MAIFCLPLRVLCPRPALTAVSPKQIKSRRYKWTRARRVLRRRSKASHSSAIASSEAPSTLESTRRRGSIGRQFVLAWKRLNRCLRPRCRSQRFSYIPEGFVLVMQGEETKQTRLRRTSYDAFE